MRKRCTCRYTRTLSKALTIALTFSLSSVLTLTSTGTLAESKNGPVHGISMHGDLKYPADFTHFDYTNPNAPKGGKLKLSALGTTFDTLNPYTLKGNAAAGLGYLYDSMLVSSSDEAFSEYGLLAQSMEIAADDSWVLFNIRPEAKWHDGKSITADDVVFTFNTLMKKGHPRFRFYYSSVDRAEKLNDHQVKYHFKEGHNRELPLIVGQLPVLPKHYWEGKEFDKTTLETPLGSGPYKIKNFEPGRFVIYERVEDYWAADLAVNKGRYNFAEQQYDYYRDGTVALEAFKSGAYDFRRENIAKQWATGYDQKVIDSGKMIKETVDHEIPTGMQAFVMNQRRSLFEDAKVRQALAYAFDFEWTNKKLFYGQYARTKSFFSNSELASSGLPSPEELAILEPYRGQIPDEVFTQAYEPPATSGDGKIRKNLKQAHTLLKQAGWNIARDGANKGKLVKDGQVFSFELLLSSPAWERITLPFAKNLERLGIEAKIRMVDSSQYQERLESFDYDIVVDVIGQSLSPGNEQRDFWSSASADRKGSRNRAGIKNPVIDELIENVIAAKDRQDLIMSTRALDRVLLWNHYVIPNWHVRNFRLAYWNKFGKPDINPKYGLGIDAWWYDESKAQELEQAQGE